MINYGVFSLTNQQHTVHSEVLNRITTIVAPKSNRSFFLEPEQEKMITVILEQVLALNFLTQ